MPASAYRETCPPPSTTPSPARRDLGARVPKLVTARRISALTYLLVVAGLIALVLLPGVPGWNPRSPRSWRSPSLWAWWLIGRGCRSWGFAERDDDLLVTRGILFRRLCRPLRPDAARRPQGRSDRRALGITTVQLHTAAATTDASIPGLPPEVAAGVRDRLAAKGEQRSAGL
jgi:hypothetical protein